MYIQAVLYVYTHSESTAISLIYASSHSRLSECVALYPCLKEGNRSDVHYPTHAQSYMYIYREKQSLHGPGQTCTLSLESLQLDITEKKTLEELQEELD